MVVYQGIGKMMQQANLIQTISNWKCISMAALRHHRMTIWQKRLTTATAATLVTLTGGTIVGLIGLAIAPAPVQAYTSRLNIDLDVQPGESYETLVRRAEAVARAAAQRSFDRDILITDVAIIITAEHQSRIAPVLSVEATRNQWRSLPDPRRWATYYNNSKVLLGMDRAPGTIAAPAPTVTTPAAAPGTTIPASSTPPGTPSAIPLSPAPTQTPNQTPNQPSNQPSNQSPSQPPSGAVNSPAGTTGTPPDAAQPDRPQILPDRIPTPAGIGK